MRVRLALLALVGLTLSVPAGATVKGGAGAERSIR